MNQITSPTLYDKDGIKTVSLKLDSRRVELSIDFLSAHALSDAFREGKQGLLSRACGIPRYGEVRIVDATAGFGNDSLLLAKLGCRVQMIERSPMIAALLEDALQRARAECKDALKPVFERISLLQEDSVEYLESCSPRPDVVLLDPMYPASKKKALVKKNMRALREVVGEDLDSELLLDSALMAATKRVVVKRMRKAPFIGGKESSFSLRGTTVRYDVYLSQ